MILVNASQGNHYTTLFRQYDPRIGRWMSLDPMSSIYPTLSPYSSYNNNPINLSDPSGAVLEGTSEISAQRQLTIIQNSAPGPECEKLRNLFKLNSDGRTFSEISVSEFEDACKGVDAKIVEVAYGYMKVINATNYTQFVCWATLGGSFSDITADFLATFQPMPGDPEDPDQVKFCNMYTKVDWSSAASRKKAAAQILKDVENNSGGAANLGRTDQTFNAQDRLLIGVFNSNANLCYTTMEGVTITAKSSLEERSAHEIIGHGLGGKSLDRWTSNNYALVMSNLILAIQNMDYFRGAENCGIDHPGLRKRKLDVWQDIYGKTQHGWLTHQYKYFWLTPSTCYNTPASMKPNFILKQPKQVLPNLKGGD